MSIGVIIASTRPGRNADAVNDWLQQQLTAYDGDLEFKTLDLKEWNLPFMDEADFPMSQNYQHDHTKKWSQAVDSCDGFIVVVPEYNRGLPAPLKNAFDYLFKEWAYKPIAFVGYSSAGAFRSVMNLRLIASEFNMVDIRHQIAINVWEAVKDGKWVAGDKYDKDVATMLAQLEWWAKLTKPARQAGDLIT